MAIGPGRDAPTLPTLLGTVFRGRTGPVKYISYLLSGSGHCDGWAICDSAPMRWCTATFRREWVVCTLCGRCPWQRLHFRIIPKPQSGRSIAESSFGEDAVAAKSHSRRPSANQDASVS